ncbi:MAG: prolyl aminopeptidase [Gammaproteobacteria bacterium]|nr:prolyl aminopeptidase [Gammaproteobacteria bacterium]
MSPHAVRAAGLRSLYPEIEPYRSGMMRVSALHEVYFEECGNPAGNAVVFVHGGPGGGADVSARRFFDPERYRIVLFDQRGCGRSTPYAELRENTTPHLVADIEQLRRELGIDRWVVFGGSWGSTLSLVYAETHPERVKALVLRGIFMLRPAELAWFYQHGASEIFPDRWEQYLEPIPAQERGDLLSAFYRRLTGDDPVVAKAAARAWSIWEGATSHLLVSEKTVGRFGADAFALALARIEAHYFVHGGFLDSPDQILRDVPKLKGIPGVIVQGRYDVVCPMTSAWDLHRAWPAAELRIVHDAGHSAFEPGTVHELVSATDRYASL